MVRKLSDIQQSKKPARPTVRPFTVGLLLLRAKRHGISVDELGVFSIGEIIDLQIEEANDHEEWDYIPTQADIDLFTR